MTTLSEFLDGEPLTYQGFNRKKHEATYRAGVGIYVEYKGRDLGLASVVSDRDARRFYHNVTRRLITGAPDARVVSRRKR